MQKSTIAQLYLVLITAIWGLTFPLLSQALLHITAQQLIFLRFSLATIILLPVVYLSLRHSTKLLIVGGFTLALLNVGVYLFQCIGMETISASRSAFITGSSVIFVPFLAPLFNFGRPKFIDALSAGVCLFGLYIITGANLAGISAGDLWVLGCAICFAVYILVVEWLTERTDNYWLLTFYQLLFVVPLSSMMVHWHHFTWHMAPIVWLTIIFCAVFASVITLFLQLKYQHYTTPTRVAIIFTLEPVFGTIFDWLINHTHVTSLTVIGGAIILIALLLPQIKTMLYSRK